MNTLINTSTSAPMATSRPRALELTGPASAWSFEANGSTRATSVAGVMGLDHNYIKQDRPPRGRLR